MVGLCGWFSAPALDVDAKARLHKLAAGLPSLRERTETAIAGHHGVLLYANSASACIFQSDQVLGVIDGDPAWRDTELARIAAGDGFARSLVQGYAEYGADIASRLRGAFALALYDNARAEALFAVDNMGRRPLCIVRGKEGETLFASSATALLHMPGVSPTLDPQSIYNYIYFHAVPAERTIFADIEKLRPACTVRINRRGKTATKHWQPDYEQTPRRPDGPLLPVMRAAVERCYRPGVTGCFLSGGLDSSSIAGVLNEQSTEPARAFSIGFAQEGYDEIEYARIATRHFDLELIDHYVQASEVAAAFGEVAAAYDEPFGNSSAVPALLCARLAAERGIQILFGGDGGDELFGGNERYATQKLFGWYKIAPGWLRRGLLEPFFGRRSVVERGGGFQHKVRRYIEQANVPMPARTQAYNLLHTTPPEEVFSSEFLALVNQDEPLDLLKRAYDEQDAATDLDRMLQMDWEFTLANNDLRKVTRMCDLAGIQVEFPFLDDDIIDYSIRVASHQKNRRLELRTFFKNEMRGYLPEEIINKSKHGFGLPFGEWLRRDDELRDLVGQRIAALRERGVFAPVWIDRLVQQHASEHAAYYGNFVWILAMFEEWCQQHPVQMPL